MWGDGEMAGGWRCWPQVPTALQSVPEAPGPADGELASEIGSIAKRTEKAPDHGPEKSPGDSAYKKP